MTVVGAGGAVLTGMEATARFARDFRKLSPELQKRTEAKLADLIKNPRPPGLRFEKLKGYSKPAIYSLHVTGNYKISFLVEGSTAILRRVAEHDEIDRAP